MANFHSDTGALFCPHHMNVSSDGRQLSLLMDKSCGSGFQSKKAFIFGKFDIRMKLVPGMSAGTVTTFYLNSSLGKWHDEIDFEFLGHTDPSHYILHTNVFVKNVGSREQRIHLWFDPTADFHTYSILWNPHQIIFYVDQVPIRVYKTGATVPFPKQQPMTLYGTIWDGSDWATEGGAIKIDWSKAPFVTYYRDYSVNACVWSGQGQSTKCTKPSPPWMSHTLDAGEWKKLEWVRKNYLIYDYCTDPSRTKPECSVQLAT
ncbi:PREDICTED: xyloglucan endotransglucosylase/hydrolase protein 20-like [Nelumbo nucifera]|nr:PREDICTED: xyloglucan endotransglucosylase/hydrolase protein 20-like [Nelumbo nucifera]